MLKAESFSCSQPKVGRAHTRNHDVNKHTWEHVDADIMRRVSARLTDDEVRALYDETRNSTAWIFGFAKELRGERGI